VPASATAPIQLGSNCAGQNIPGTCTPRSNNHCIAAITVIAAWLNKTQTGPSPATPASNEIAPATIAREAAGTSTMFVNNAPGVNQPNTATLVVELTNVAARLIPNSPSTCLPIHRTAFRPLPHAGSGKDDHGCQRNFSQSPNGSPNSSSAVTTAYDI
jgi:hypothetical protein